MFSKKHIFKIIISLIFIISLQACGSSFELTEKEVQLYAGQIFNPSLYVSEEYNDNVKLTVKNTVNTSFPGTYNVIYAYDGVERILKVNILPNPIMLKFNEITLETGDSFEPKSYLESGSLINDIDIKSNVKTSIPGDYVVVYSYDGIEKTVRVFVRDLVVSIPEKNVAIDLGSTFNPLSYVTLNFPSSKNLQVDHDVDLNHVGQYTVNYIYGQSKQTLNVTVKDVSPFLTTTQASIKHGSTFDPKSFLIETDRTNPDITITNPVKTNVAGSYVVTYKLGSIEKSLNVTVSAAATTATKPTSPTPTTPKEPTTPTAPSYKLSVVSLTSPVSPNEHATITVKGRAGKTYSIVVNYKSGPSTAAGLDPQVADSDGMLSWTWKIGGRTSAGDWKITISGNGETVSTYITVR